VLGLKRNYFIKINFKSNFIHKTRFTGLVIDARGLNLNPCIKPAILNERRELFFYFDNVKWEYILKYGFITYVTSSEALKYLKDIIGDKPFKMSALDSFGINNTDIIVHQNDLNTFLGFEDNYNILYEGRIVVIVDKK
jgi:hypothetical protein